MPLILTPSQIERVQKTIPNCCNWDEGICLLLEMPCPQQLSVTRINCKYFFTKIVVAEDGFHWYIRVTGDPDKPLHCKVEGKRRSTTKIVVTQDFSPALDSSTTGCYQGLRFNPITNPRPLRRLGIFAVYGGAYPHELDFTGSLCYKLYIRLWYYESIG